MGVRASTLTGRAVVDPRLLHLTKWKERQVDDMLIAHEHDLGGRFALGPRHAAVLLGMTDDEARPIFELMAAQRENTWLRLEVDHARRGERAQRHQWTVRAAAFLGAAVAF